MRDTQKNPEAWLQFRKTERGFVVAHFRDRYGEECSIQESSLAEEAAIWLGEGSHRMHLTQGMVEQLLPVLEHFLKTGGLPAPQEPGT